MEVKSKGTNNWLDDTVVLSKSITGHWGLLRAISSAFVKTKLTVTLQKSAFFQSSMKFVRMIVDRLGTWPSAEKTGVVTQLSRPMTMENVRVLLSMARYLRKFVPHYRIAVAQISNLLRDFQVRTKMQGSRRCQGGKSSKKSSTPFSNC